MGWGSSSSHCENKDFVPFIEEKLYDGKQEKLFRSSSLSLFVTFLFDDEMLSSAPFLSYLLFPLLSTFTLTSLLFSLSY